MTLRWVIFSKIAAWLCFFSQVASPATVTGVATLTDSPNQRHSEQMDAPTTVIWLSPANAAASTRQVLRARMLQKDKHFEPHVLAIEVGTAVDFPNLDAIFHNAFSNFDGKLFDIGLYPPNTSRSIVFDRAGIVRVFCNIHPSMSAVIVVLATPFFSSADRKGAYMIPNVPAGEYRLRFFNERATPETLDALSKKVLVTDPQVDIAPVSIAKAPYIPAPHKNKYGKDYPPEQTNIYH